jgi:hypothetical protein
MSVDERLKIMTWPKRSQNDLRNRNEKLSSPVPFNIASQFSSWKAKGHDLIWPKRSQNDIRIQNEKLSSQHVEHGWTIAPNVTTFHQINMRMMSWLLTDTIFKFQEDSENDSVTDKV